MISTTRNALMFACIWATACATAVGGGVDSFDDIVYWTGAGANRAAIVIDFDGDVATDQSLVWGFRWDGTARGRDMLNATVIADARLFARIGDSGTQLGGVMGVGYDRTNDGQFEISEGGPFDDAGFAYGSPNESTAEEDPVHALDAGDWYEEGWFDGFWHYGISAGNPWTTGHWAFSQAGASTRTLHDGDWDSWAFTADADNPSYYNTVYAKNPMIATPPGGHADFDGDDAVDGDDFLAWQRGVGLAAPTPMQGDATGDGLVDGADLTAWQAQYHGGAASPVASAVPEPAILTTCASAMFVLIRMLRQHTRQQRRSDS